MPEAALDLAAELAGLVVPGGRPGELEVLVRELGERVVRKTRAGLRHPALAHGALRHGGSVLGVAVEDGEDTLLHLERRRAARVLDLGEAGRLVVGRGLARGEDRLVHRPRAGVREHGLLQQLGARVHERHGVDRARRAGGRVRIRAFAGADARPTLGLVALERVDRAPIGAAVRVPVHGVRVGGHPGGVEADRGVEVVVEARRGVDRLRAADLLRRLAEEDERAREAVALQRLLGGEHPAERAGPERRVGVGVAGRLLVHALARLAVRHGLLAVAGDGVVLGVGAEDGPATAEARPERRRHAGGALLDVEAELTEEAHVVRGRAVLAPGRLVEVPDRPRRPREPVAMLVDPGVRRPLRLAQTTAR